MWPNVTSYMQLPSQISPVGTSASTVGAMQNVMILPKMEENQRSKLLPAKRQAVNVVEQKITKRPALGDITSITSNTNANIQKQIQNEPLVKKQPTKATIIKPSTNIPSTTITTNPIPSNWKPFTTQPELLPQLVQLKMKEEKKNYKRYTS